MRYYIVMRNDETNACYIFSFLKQLHFSDVEKTVGEKKTTLFRCAFYEQKSSKIGKNGRKTAFLTFENGIV